MVHKSIADMRKVYMAEEKERLATAEVEEQPSLKINPNRGPRLQVHLPARARACVRACAGLHARTQVGTYLLTLIACRAAERACLSESASAWAQVRG